MKTRLPAIGITAILMLSSFSASAAAQSGKSARGFIEPPYLADQVASGKLPPIDQRLPDQPFVVGPGTLLDDKYVGWQDGQYGGTIKLAINQPDGFVNIAGGSTVLRSPSQTTDASLPNVVSAWSHSDDYTTYNFTIRKGLKWSDGVPVTTEDVRFTFDDLYNTPNVEAVPSELYTQGDPTLPAAQLKVIDDLNFSLTFSKPYGFYVGALNSWIPGYNEIFKPAHYLKQFHAKYAQADALAKLVTDNKQSSWQQLINLKDQSHWGSGEIAALGEPVLNAWVLTSANDTQRVFERNPYFWHVDASGHQLPYIDKVVDNLSVDLPAVTNAVLAGQVTVASGNEVALNNMPVYVQAGKANGLKVFTSGSFNNPILLFLNHDFEYDKPNSVWQTLIADPQHRFGQALTLAMNPDDINKSVYFGLYGALNPLYKYNDPAQANQLLDALGMDKRGSDGFRLGPDGQPFVLRITHAGEHADEATIGELLKQQFEAVGVHTEVQQVDISIFNTRKTSNDIMASLLWNDGPSWGSGMSRDYQPVSKGPWSPATWTYVTTQGAKGRKPPAYIQTFYDLDAARQAYPASSPDGQAIFTKMVKWFADNYVMIPTAGTVSSPNIVDARLRNTPSQGAPVELDLYINAEGYWFASQ